MRETEGFLPQLFILHYSSFIIHYWVYRNDKPKFEKNTNKRTAIPRKEGQPFFRYDHYFCLMSPTSLQNSMITVGTRINPKAMR